MNSSITLSLPWVPYVEVPLNTTSCSRPNPTPLSLVDTCGFMQYLASNLTSDLLTCSSPSSPVCNQINCLRDTNNSTFSISVLPCHHPPAVQLLSMNNHRKVLFNQTFTAINMSVRANVAGIRAVLDIFIVQHTSNLTLGLGVSHFGLWSSDTCLEGTIFGHPRNVLGNLFRKIEIHLVVISRLLASRGRSQPLLYKHKILPP